MAGEPLVIGLDSSTQSTKAIAWTARGEAVAEGRAPVTLSYPRLGWVEQDPDDWRRSCRAALKELMAQVAPGDIQGLAISNQRETVAFLDPNFRSVRPAMVWLDERAGAEVDRLKAELGPQIHQISGRPIDIIPCLYRIAWLRAHEPEAFDRTALFADVQAVLVQDLCGGPARTSWSSADPFGMFDLRQKVWSDVLCGAVGVATDRLAEAVAPGTQLGEITAAAATATGLPAGLPVFAGGGDGQCAGLGTNCTDPRQAYANLGTAVVSGVWQPDYRISDHWRTEIAAQGEGYIFENCLRGGAYVVNWFVGGFLGGEREPGIYDRLEAEASRLPIGSEGVLVQPWWGGVMDPYWDSGTRGTVLGLTGAHGPAHVFRAILEGITVWLAGATAAAEATAGRQIDHYVAIGGGAKSALWRQMLADASGRPVRVSGTVEASALGAGMIAARAAGWFDSFEEAATAMCGATVETLPDPACTRRYDELRAIFEDTYAACAGINRRLVAFAQDGAA